MITSQTSLSTEETLMEKKKYVIDVDFPTVSKIHLNPVMYEINPRCEPTDKDPINGGIVYATEDEVEEYLAVPGALVYDGRKVTNLRTCPLCAKLPDYDLA